MRIFARQRTVPHVVPYTDYCSGYTEQQEHYICWECNNDWRTIHNFEIARGLVYQAREIGIALPNEWIPDPNNVTEEQRLSVKSHVRNMVCNILGKEKYERNEIDFHAHYNSKGNNLHVHIVYTDRQWQDVKPIIIGQYDRDIYHTIDGKVAKKKANRAADVSGNFLPAVHKKGDNIIKRGSDSILSNRDKFFGKWSWMAGTKQKIKEYYETNGVKVLRQHPCTRYMKVKGIAQKRFYGGNITRKFAFLMH